MIKLFQKKYMLVFEIFNENGSIVIRDFVTGNGKFTIAMIEQLEDKMLKRTNELNLQYPYTLAQLINIIKIK